jgi:hypothetical protein
MELSAISYQRSAISLRGRESGSRLSARSLPDRAQRIRCALSSGRCALAPILSLALCACQSMPETYAPPVQRQPFENFRPYRSSRIVNMSDGDATVRIVRDVDAGLAGSWRWTGQHPTIRVPGGPAEDLLYVIDFTLPEVTFKDTGPVTLSFYVNDRLLDRVRYSSPGVQHFEKPVPAGWVQEDQEATVGAEIDKIWTSPEDGQRLGFILTSIGLKQQ